MTVKELREKYKLTQSALAKSLGVSSNAISAVEAGRLKLSNKLAAKIMETYGEDVAAAPAVKAEKADRPEAKIEKPAAEPAAEAAAAPAAKAVEAAPAAPAAECVSLLLYRHAEPAPDLCADPASLVL